MEWSDCPKQRMKNLDYPEKKWQRQGLHQHRDGRCVIRVQGDADKAAKIQAREDGTKQKLEKLEENAKRFAASRCCRRKDDALGEVGVVARVSGRRKGWPRRKRGAGAREARGGAPGGDG